MEPIRVLHVFGGLDSGGAESRTMDIYRQIDKRKVQFDFLIHTQKVGFFEDEIIRMGGRIYRVPRFSTRTIISYQRALNDFFNKHSEYKVVHGHMLSTAFIYQNIAKKHRIPVRIAHSRCGSRSEINIENMIKELFKRLTRFYVSDKFAVSKVAGASAFGNHSVSTGEVKILPNAIKTEKYLFDNDVRNRTRRDLNIEGKFVIGHIGRFQRQKNHDFIIKIFNEVHSRLPNSLLLLVGDGELKSEIEEKVMKLGLNNSVVFTGVRSDVPDLLQAMDILLFPSFVEGLPGVVLEAQAAGLPCIISDKITNEVKVTDLVEYVSLDKSIEYWVEKVIPFSNGYSRRNTLNDFEEAGFDIEAVAKWYQDFYIESYSE